MANRALWASGSPALQCGEAARFKRGRKNPRARALLLSRCSPRAKYFAFSTVESRPTNHPSVRPRHSAACVSSLQLRSSSIQNQIDTRERVGTRISYRKQTSECTPDRHSSHLSNFERPAAFRLLFASHGALPETASRIETYLSCRKQTIAHPSTRDGSHHTHSRYGFLSTLTIVGPTMPQLPFVSSAGLAPRRGLEPRTFRLTAERSTIELPGNCEGEFMLEKSVRRCSQRSQRMWPAERQRPGTAVSNQRNREGNYWTRWAAASCPMRLSKMARTCRR
jgi:hypothetical protein